MEVLKKLRKESNLNQQDVANHLQITVSAYGNYELGQRKPTPEMLIKLADYFDVSVDYLLGRTKNIGWSPSEQSHGIKHLQSRLLTAEEDDFIEDYREIGRKKGQAAQQLARKSVKLILEN